MLNTTRLARCALRLTDLVVIADRIKELEGTFSKIEALQTQESVNLVQRKSGASPASRVTMVMVKSFFAMLVPAIAARRVFHFTC